jgi:hypothetical protein
VARLLGGRRGGPDRAAVVGQAEEGEVLQQGIPVEKVAYLVAT